MKLKQKVNTEVTQTKCLVNPSVFLTFEMKVMKHKIIIVVYLRKQNIKGIGLIDVLEN